MRERPWLAREVADVADLHPDFLGDFARQALLEGLAGLDEAGQRAIHAGREMRAAREEQLAAAVHQRHHRRRHSRIRSQLAGGADAYAPVALGLGRRAAAAPGLA